MSALEFLTLVVTPLGALAIAVLMVWIVRRDTARERDSRKGSPSAHVR